MSDRISRYVRLAFGSVGFLLCAYVLGTSLVARRAPGINRSERIMGVEWLAADHPAQYGTVLLLMAGGAIAFGRTAWRAYSR